MAVSRRAVRYTSTSERPTTWWEHATVKDKRVLYTAGGTGIAVLALLWPKSSENDYPDDRLDTKALSKVPLGKLFSGWV